MVSDLGRTCWDPLGSGLTLRVQVPNNHMLFLLPTYKTTIRPLDSGPLGLGFRG